VTKYTDETWITRVFDDLEVFTKVIYIYIHIRI